MSRRFARIRVQLAGLILIAVLPVAALALYSGLEWQRAAIAGAREETLRLTRLIAADQAALVEGARQLLATLANSAEVRSSDADTCSAFLASLIRQSPRYANLGVTRPNGDAWCSAAPLTGPLNLADRTWFQNALQGRTFTLGNYQISRATGQAVAVFAQPVLDDGGAVQGVVSAALNLDWLEQFIADAQLPEGSAITVVDRQGTVLARWPDPAGWVGQTLPETAVVQAILAEPAGGLVEAPGLDGVARVYGFGPLSAGPALEAYVAIGVPASVVYADANRLLAITVAGLAGAVIVALSLSWHVAEVALARRVQALLRATRRLAAGDLGARTGMAAGLNELGELAHAFDQMAAGLEQREAALRRSEANYRALFEHAADGLFISDATGRLVDANASGCRLLGYSHAELLSLSLEALLPPDGRERVPLRLAELRAGQPVTLERQLRRQDGRPLEAEISGQLLPDGRLLGIVRDITERKRAEARLRLQSTALEATANAIVITDRDGVIQWVNPAYTRLTGYAAAEVIGSTPRLLKSGRHDQAFYQRLWETILAGQVWEGELVNRRQDGQLYDEWQTITPVADEAGALTHFISVKQDITERKQRERELESITAVSAALRKAKSRAEMVPIILDQLRLLLNAGGATLEVREGSTGNIVVELGRGDWQSLTGFHLVPDSGLTLEIIQTGRLYRHDNAHQDPGFRQPELLRGPQAVIGVPLIVQQAAIGVLWLGRQAPFTDAEVQIVVAVADLAANALHRAALHEQTERRLSQVQALRRIDQAITSSLDARAALNVVLEETTRQLGVDAADVLLFNAHRQTLEYAAGRGLGAPPLTDYVVRLGEGHAGRAVLERRTIHVPDLGALAAPGRRTRLLGGERFVAYAAVPLLAKGQVKGVLEIFHKTPLQADQEWHDFLDTLAGQAAIAIEDAELFGDLQRSNAELTLAYDATIEGWSRALDLRDHETEGHTQRVTEMALRLGQALGLGQAELVHLRRGALLHDIGKMGVPDQILLKPGPLTNDEWVVMRTHPTLAYDMLAPIAFLRPALDIPYCHHEKWDGTGYPRGLRGETIPLAARLFAVVDVWDALRSDRPYRPAWPETEVHAYLREQVGRHFDPQIVETFLRLEPPAR